MIKKNEISDPNSCLNKAADDEPLFVLWANDPLAVRVVDCWASLSLSSGHHGTAKRAGAIMITVEMRLWRAEKGW